MSAPTRTNLPELADCALNALHAHIAIVDKRCEIVSVNSAWRQFARQNIPGGLIARQLLEGANYLEVCERAGTPESLQFAAGMQSVLEQAQLSFTLEYACEGPMGLRWFIGVVTPLMGYSEPGLVIAHYDITERKFAEETLQLEESRTKALITELRNTQLELQEKLHDLETFHDLVVDRELRMIELEKENRKLRELTTSPIQANACSNQRA